MQKPRFHVSSLVAVALVVGAPTTGAIASGVDHRGARTVCVKSAWIEKGPADHPIAVASRGDHFQVTRAQYATVHHSDGSAQRWAKGTLTHVDAKAKRTFRYRGWIRVTALGVKCG